MAICQEFYPTFFGKVKEHRIPLSGLSKLRVLTERSLQTLHQVLRVPFSKGSGRAPLFSWRPRAGRYSWAWRGRSGPSAIG